MNTDETRLQKSASPYETAPKPQDKHEKAHPDKAVESEKEKKRPIGVGWKFHRKQKRIRKIAKASKRRNRK